MNDKETVSDFPHFGDAYVAFFNQRPDDVIAGERAVVEKFSQATLNSVKSCMLSGPMEIFQHPQTPAALAYVMGVAKSREMSANA